jgi:hypothetical protein
LLWTRRWFHEPVVIVLDVTNALPVPPAVTHKKPTCPEVKAPNDQLILPFPPLKAPKEDGIDTAVLKILELANEA